MPSSGAFDQRIDVYGRLREAYHRLDAAFAPTYEEHGLSTTWFEAMLRITRAEDERLRMCDLAEQIALTTGGATRMVDALIREAYVERVADDTDRRVQLVKLTTKGRRKLDDVVESHLDDLDREFLGRLSQREIAQLSELLDRIRVAEPSSPNTRSTPQ